MRQSSYFRQPRVFCRPPLAILIVVSILTVAWQATLWISRSHLDATYEIGGASGTSPELNSYIYFYYYENLFPITTLDLLFSELPDASYSAEAAEQILVNQPDVLRMDNKYRIRTGDLGRVMLLLPHAWLTGDPADTDVRFTLAPLFVVSLLMVLVSFWMNDYFYIGALIVLFVGSHPTQIYETYGREQVFSLPISTMLVMLSLYLPLLLKRRVSVHYALGLVVVSGILLGTVRQVRAEAVLPILSALLALALAAQFRLWTRGLLIALLIGAFWLTSKGWQSYFQFKFNQAYDVVEEVGGYPLAMGSGYHVFWHPLYTGLGDFGDDRGFHWVDESVEAKILPKMDEADLVYDRLSGDGSIYRKPVWLLPEYEETVKQEFLAEIRGHPLWYVGVLFKRLAIALIALAPITLAFGPVSVSIPFLLTGIPTLFIAYVMVRNRAWIWLRVILFTLPLMLTPLMIYALDGFTFYALYPHLEMSLVLAAGILYVFNRFYGYRHDVIYLEANEETGAFRLSRQRLTRSQATALGAALLLVVSWASYRLYRDGTANERRFADLYAAQAWANDYTPPDSVFAGTGELFGAGLDRAYVELTPREWRYYADDPHLVMQAERVRDWYGLLKDQDHPGSDIFYRLTGQQWLVLREWADVDYVLVRQARRYWPSSPFKIVYENDDYAVYDVHQPVEPALQPIDALVSEDYAGTITPSGGFMLDPGQGLNSIRANIALDYVPSVTHNQNLTNLYANVADIDGFFAHDLWTYPVPAALLRDFEVAYVYADEGWLAGLTPQAKAALDDSTQFERLFSVTGNGAIRQLYAVRHDVSAAASPSWLNTVPYDPQDNSSYHLYAQWDDVVPAGARVVMPVVEELDERLTFVPRLSTDFPLDSAWYADFNPQVVLDAGFDYVLISDYLFGELPQPQRLHARLNDPDQYRLVAVWQVTEPFVPLPEAEVVPYALYEPQP